MYTKVFDSMFDGTLATKGPWQAVVTFQQMLILADPQGVVDMTPEAIARRTTIPLDIITIGIEALEAPDPDSRLSNEAGRRIVRLDDHRTWGWQIVNFLHYRNIRNEHDRREYMKELMRRRRAAAKGAGQAANVSNVSSALASVSNVSPRIRIRNKNHVRSKITIAPSGGFETFWQAMPAKRRVGKKACLDKWRAKHLDEIAPTIMEHVAAMVATKEWRDGYNPSPLTYLNQERWGDGNPAAPSHTTKLAL